VNKKHAMPNSAVIAADPITGITGHDELDRSSVKHPRPVACIQPKYCCRRTKDFLGPQISGDNANQKGAQSTSVRSAAISF